LELDLAPKLTYLRAASGTCSHNTSRRESTSLEKSPQLENCHFWF